MKKFDSLLIFVFACGAACSDDPEAVDGFVFQEVAELSEGEMKDGAVDLVFTPDRSGDYFLFYRSGRIEHRNSANDILKTRKLTTRRHNECGGLAIELDPGFAQNQLIYLGFCVVDGGVELRSMIWKSDAPEALDVAETTPILSWEKGVNDYHNLGDLGWDGDLLWITYGDGNRLDTSQDPMDLRGKLLRIVPHRDGTPGYSIPADNPFAGEGDGVADEVIAWGLKSSFRSTLAKNIWFLAEVGVDHFEEINLITIDGPGRNLGHPRCEGIFTLDPADYQPTENLCDIPEPEYLQAAHIYPHDPDSNVVSEDPAAEDSETEGFAITGGILYEGSAYGGALTGNYIYSDNQRHFVRRIELDATAMTLKNDRHLGHVENVWAWVVGPDELIYAVTPDRLFRLATDPR